MIIIILKNNAVIIILAIGAAQPLTEISTRNLPGDKGRPARKANNLAAMYEPNV
jgi:hypothetical protein